MFASVFYCETASVPKLFVHQPEVLSWFHSSCEQDVSEGQRVREHQRELERSTAEFWGHLKHSLLQLESECVMGSSRGFTSNQMSTMNRLRPTKQFRLFKWDAAEMFECCCETAIFVVFCSSLVCAFERNTQWAG